MPAEVRLYNPLFTKPEPDVANFAGDLNPNSLEVLRDARVEPALAADNSPAPVQFERQGYFARDPDSAPGKPVFNRTVGLRDTYAKAREGTPSARSPASRNVNPGDRAGDRPRIFAAGAASIRATCVQFSRAFPPVHGAPDRQPIVAFGGFGCVRVCAMAQGRGTDTHVGRRAAARRRVAAGVALGGAREVLARWFATDMAAGRLMPWLPICFGLGVVLYFTAEREPVAVGGARACGRRARSRRSLRARGRSRFRCCSALRRSRSALPP